MLRLSQPLYVGGMKHFGDMAHAVGEHRHFQGCIQKVSHKHVTKNCKTIAWFQFDGNAIVKSCDSDTLRLTAKTFVGI